MFQFTSIEVQYIVMNLAWLVNIVLFNTIIDYFIDIVRQAFSDEAEIVGVFELSPENPRWIKPLILIP